MTKIKRSNGNTMAYPLVSIITPCYDDGDFLHLPISSVLEQPYENFEMILVNDGSTSAATLAVLDGIDHPRIRVIHQPNKGLAGARNTGIRAAKGKYILPLDADDMITPSCLTRSVEVLEAAPEHSVVYGNYRTFGVEERLVRTGRFNTYRIFFNNFMPVCAMFRRSAWDSVGGYTEELPGSEDWEFWMKLIKNGHEFRKVDEVLFLYHQRANSMGARIPPADKGVVAQIKSLHADMYRPKTLKRLRAENKVTWFEDIIYHIPIPLLYRMGKTRFRHLLRVPRLLGLYRDI